MTQFVIVWAAAGDKLQWSYEDHSSMQSRLAVQYPEAWEACQDFMEVAAPGSFAILAQSPFMIFAVGGTRE